MSTRRQSRNASRTDYQYYADHIDFESDEEEETPGILQDSSIITLERSNNNQFMEPKNDDTAFLGSNIHLIEQTEPQSDLVRRSMQIMNEQKKTQGSNSLIDKRMVVLNAFEEHT